MESSVGNAGRDTGHTLVTSPEKLCVSLVEKDANLPESQLERGVEDRPLGSQPGNSLEKRHPTTRKPQLGSGGAPHKAGDKKLGARAAPFRSAVKVPMCDVVFPFASERSERSRDSFLSSVTGESTSRQKTPSGLGGVVPRGDASFTVMGREERWLTFRQSGRALPSLRARIVHPQGFRILKSRSVLERSLRSYFRLPPAPCEYLRNQRLRSQRQLLVADMKEDTEEVHLFNTTLERQFRFRQSGLEGMPPAMLLDGYLLLCAGGESVPEAVRSVTLQGCRLVDVIADDMAHFTNLSFLDVSENELGLEHLLSLSSLEVLHLAYNKISSLAGVVKAVKKQQTQEDGPKRRAYYQHNFRNSAAGDTEFEGPRESTPVRSAAAYYAERVSKSNSIDKGTEQVDSDVPCVTKWREVGDTGSDKWSHDNPACGSPHVKTTDSHFHDASCNAQDVLLPNLHALNLSFNSVPPADILHLSYFPMLEKLDLSGNKLRRLPSDLTHLISVTHFALEGNLFSDDENVFMALATMPALVEVNLNHNKLRRVPQLSVKDGRGLCFPSIEVIGLHNNCVERACDISPLSDLVRTLTRVVLSGNPIAGKNKERSAAQAHFAQAVMSRYWEQAGMRSKGTKAFESGPYGTDTLQASESFPPRQRSGNGPRERSIATSEKGKLTDVNSIEDNSLYEVWQAQQKQMKANSPVHRYNDQDEEEDIDVLNDPVGLRHHDNVGVCCYGSDLSENMSTKEPCLGEPHNATPSPLVACDAMLGKFTWYSDAPTFHTHFMRMNEAEHGLPSPSLIRFVELVFTDSVMHKKRLVDFYAKRREQCDEVSSASAMVHPKTGLVTVPKYNEYMDVHRLLGETSRKGRAQARRYRSQNEKKERHKAEMAVSIDQEDDLLAGLPADSELMEEAEVHSRVSSSREEGLQSDSVFLTGVALEGGRGNETREERPKRKERSLSSHEMEEQDETNVPPSGKQKEDDDQPRPRPKHGCPPLRMTVEPPGVNARILMNELRVMLRRPLPPLPRVSSTLRTRGRRKSAFS
ncbi:hypothetical protein ERJ75_000947900 [Trypanosoma vivax]|uniref:Leucine-rich repeat protein (LRRP) n=1 Tax=Trypanosoma vivax (strain Y486) TaxID=1055687 RepID=G0U4I3_TRYVY|nr:hypothetical protein TRVL_00609 [Trypanosoma vivax]KAH8611552.1 hypothetical protein ERJ75_000947900 [Trypanosoma vivax]CCC52347.1 conserved hypothetical protein [Trypanosoma vivax Y486]